MLLKLNWDIHRRLSILCSIVVQMATIFGFGTGEAEACILVLPRSGTILIWVELLRIIVRLFYMPVRRDVPFLRDFKKFIDKFLVLLDFIFEFLTADL